MRTVGLRILKNKPGEYVRLVAQGETVLIADRDRVAAELVPPRPGRASDLPDALLADLVRRGAVTPALLAPGTRPRTPEPLVASRPLEYELWSRVHARRAARTHGEAAREILARVSLVELTPAALAHALEPFPAAVRTLDALHPAALHYLREARQRVRLATFDARLRRAALALGMPTAF